MNTIVAKALSLWNLEGAESHLVAARENAVYKITTESKTYALRLHRQGYRSDAQLRSELTWMKTAELAGIKVPAPIETPAHDLLCKIDGVQVDVLNWLPGQTMMEYRVSLNSAQNATLFYKLGRQMALLHCASDAWTQPEAFDRPAWDLDGLLGEQPLWDRFWENPALSKREQVFFQELRTRLYAELRELQSSLDYGLIHADLVEANVMVHDDELYLIDFDDGGYGYRLFELATALVKHTDAADYAELHHALTSGYTSARSIDLRHLDLFILLRALTYVGWNITRLSENGAEERNQRFIKTARQLALAYLDT